MSTRPVPTSAGLVAGVLTVVALVVALAGGVTGRCSRYATPLWSGPARTSSDDAAWRPGA